MQPSWVCRDICNGLVNFNGKLGHVLAFFRLKRLLKGHCVAVTGDYDRTYGVVYVGWGLVLSTTTLWHIEAILVLTNAISALSKT